jgi:hypothetical protein
MKTSTAGRRTNIKMRMTNNMILLIASGNSKKCRNYKKETNGFALNVKIISKPSNN